MRTLVACCGALLLALCEPIAFGGTEIQLPSPRVLDYYTNSNCNYQPVAWTAANGFSADGNYLNGISKGYVACGHSGRGSNLRYTYYCMFDVWDLSGNLISVTVQPYLTCPQKQPGVTWTGLAGYSAHTVTNTYYGYISSQYAVLVTP